MQELARHVGNGVFWRGALRAHVREHLANVCLVAEEEGFHFIAVLPRVVLHRCLQCARRSRAAVGMWALDRKKDMVIGRRRLLCI